jgi:hypothetical protein
MKESPHAEITVMMKESRFLCQLEDMRRRSPHDARSWIHLSTLHGKGLLGAADIELCNLEVSCKGCSKKGKSTGSTARGETRVEDEADDAKDEVVAERSLGVLTNRLPGQSSASQKRSNRVVELVIFLAFFVGVFKRFRVHRFSLQLGKRPLLGLFGCVLVHKTRRSNAYCNGRLSRSA